MAATAAPRKTVSIYDYPEHLNPFHEEDNHNKIRFWTLGKKLSRSNSITFSGIKDLKNSWALRSFMRKGKKGSQTSSQTNKTNNQTHDEQSPIMYRRAMQYSSTNTLGARNTVGGGERYVYGGSVTPLPRSRFQERLRSPSQCEVNTDSTTPRMARSEVMGSRLSVESTNPFDGDPVPPIRASRRKKKRAPLPPPALHTTAEVVVSEIAPNTSRQIVEDKKQTSSINEDLDKIHFDVELKIVEDEDVNITPTQPNSSADPIEDSNETKRASPANQNGSFDREKRLSNGHVVKDSFETKDYTFETKDYTNRNADSDDEILSQGSFPKIDIIKYRRNSSLNEDDIRLRRGNLEDFHLSNQRSKSLSNALNGSYLVYDINLNEKEQDTNGNEKPKKVICKLYDETPRKESLDNSISSTEKEFLEIDKATRELEKEISKLNSALNDDDDVLTGARLSVSDIRRKFDKNESSSPNPIPKPRRSHYGGSSSPITENIHK